MDDFKFIHQALYRVEDRLDMKASILMAMKLFIAGFFLDKLHIVDFANFIDVILMTAFAISSVLAFKYVIMVLYPQLSSNDPNSLIYFKHIAESDKIGHAQTLMSLKEMNKEDMRNSLINHIISLSVLADKKYKYVQRGIVFILLESTFLVILLLV